MDSRFLKITTTTAKFSIKILHQNPRSKSSIKILYQNPPIKMQHLIAARREAVIQAYNSAKAENNLRFLEGDEKATAEYIFENQYIDAAAIVDEFYHGNRRVISVTKKTKVGMDGLMIEVAKLMTTHPDDTFVVNPASVRIVTGMSNAGWEKDMKDKSPNCFKDKIFHHGQLKKADLRGLRNALVIIDEIDTGDKEYQVLHNTLKDAGVLDVRNMQESNNRFLFASATMIKELYDLYRWGELHKWYKMTIPASYIGHIDFLERGIVQEFYSLATPENAEKWVQEDILDHYGADFRVHIARVTVKTVGVLQDACIRKAVDFRNHTSHERLSDKEIRELFKEPLTKHIVLGVKGFFRRANLIPNRWKLRIGATHELYTRIVDNNVQIQGLTGRMTGYWRDVIESGHKTGPHRTSVRAIQQYEEVFNDPFGTNSYQTAGFRKREGEIVADPTMISAKNIAGLEAADLPEGALRDDTVDIRTYRIYSDESRARAVCQILGYTFRRTSDNAAGFKETSLNTRRGVASLDDAVRKVPTAYGTNDGVRTYRTYYPCYVDTADRATLRFVVIIRPDTDVAKVADADMRFPAIPYVATP